MKKIKKILVTFLGYTLNSNDWLIYSYMFLYIIIIFTYRKMYFHLYTIGEKKNYHEKFNTFTCRIVLPEINLWFYYYQECKSRLANVWQFTMLTIASGHSCRKLQF